MQTNKGKIVSAFVSGNNAMYYLWNGRQQWLTLFLAYMAVSLFIAAQWRRIWGHMSLLTMTHSTWLRCRFFFLLNRRTLEIPSDFEIKGGPYSKIFHLFREWIQDFPEEELTRPRGVSQKLNENERDFTFPYEMNTNGVKAHCTEYAKNSNKVDLLTIGSIGNVDIIDLTCGPRTIHTAVLRRKQSKNNTWR